MPCQNTAPDSGCPVPEGREGVREREGGRGRGEREGGGGRERGRSVTFQ